MVTINPDHVNQLIQRESEVHYDESPPRGKWPYVIVRRNSPVLLSAPHGAKTYRNSAGEQWHEEDEYTAGMALLLAELCETSVIATTWRINRYDPNYYETCAYKRRLAGVIQKAQVRYVIDLHGAALRSKFLDPNQTIDLGIHGNKARKQSVEQSMEEDHVSKLEHYLRITDDTCDPANFVVDRNRLPANGSGTITTFAHNQLTPGTQTRVQAVQIEMKPQVRIAQRFPTATLYKSAGPYDADPNCVVHMLQALVNFIEYLKATP